MKPSTGISPDFLLASPDRSSHMSSTSIDLDPEHELAHLPVVTSVVDSVEESSRSEEAGGQETEGDEGLE